MMSICNISVYLCLLSKVRQYQAHQWWQSQMSMNSVPWKSSMSIDYAVLVCLLQVCLS